MKNINSTLLDLIGTKPILFNPLLAEISGSINSGLLLSQFLYWQSTKGNGVWWYKTIEELEIETKLTRSMQDTALKFWIDFEIIETMVDGFPPKRHFRINMDKLIGIVNTHSKRRIAVNKNGRTFVPIFDKI